MAPGLGCTLQVGNEEHLSQEERSSCQATHVSSQTPTALAWHQLPQPSEQEKWHRPGVERKADPRLRGEILPSQVSSGLKERCWWWPLSRYPRDSCGGLCCLFQFDVRALWQENPTYYRRDFQHALRSGCRLSCRGRTDGL